jgi:hypothetical protein
MKNRERNNTKCISYLPKCYTPNDTSPNADLPKRQPPQTLPPGITKESRAYVYKCGEPVPRTSSSSSSLPPHLLPPQSSIPSVLPLPPSLQWPQAARVNDQLNPTPSRHGEYRMRLTWICVPTFGLPTAPAPITPAAVSARGSEQHRRLPGVAASNGRLTAGCRGLCRARGHCHRHLE